MNRTNRRNNFTKLCYSKRILENFRSTRHICHTGGNLRRSDGAVWEPDGRATREFPHCLDVANSHTGSLLPSLALRGNRTANIRLPRSTRGVYSHGGNLRVYRYEGSPAWLGRMKFLVDFVLFHIGSSKIFSFQEA